MTTIIEQDIGPISTRPVKRRRLWLRVVIGVVLLAIIAGGISWEVYARSYQPWDNSEGGSGPAVFRHQHLRAIGDGVDQTYWLVTGRPGTQATVDYTVSNDGSHAATLLGLNQHGRGPINAVEWSDYSPDNKGNGSVIGAATNAQAFPVTLAPKTSVIVQVTVTREACPSGGYSYVSAIPLRWSALGVQHTWNMQLAEEDFDKPILLCAPQTANRER